MGESLNTSLRECMRMAVRMRAKGLRLCPAPEVILTFENPNDKNV